MRYRRASDRAAAGFTLVEVSILLAVVSILAAIIAPVMGSTIAEAKLAAAQTEIRALAVALRAFLEDIACDVIPQRGTDNKRIAAGVVRAPFRQPPIAPPPAHGSNSARSAFGAAAAGDPCSITELCSTSPVELLVSVGDIPALDQTVTIFGRDLSMARRSIFSSTTWSATPLGVMPVSASRHRRIASWLQRQSIPRLGGEPI